MDYVGIESLKNAYIDQLISEGEDKKAEKLHAEPIEKPIFDGYIVHPEDEPDTAEINDVISDISLDMYAVRKETENSAQLYRDLCNEIKLRLDAVDEIAAEEEERIKDMNAICGNYDEFSNVITLHSADFIDSTFLTKDNRTFSCPGSEKEISYDIVSIIGNGYEGNEFVYDKNDGYLKDTMDTSVREYINDGSLATYYEYSRLTVDKSEPRYPAIANTDNEEARCAVVIASAEDFTSMKISSDIDNVIVEDVLISDDNGTTYRSVMRHKSIPMNRIDSKYNDGNYIYGTGIIAVPPTNVVKVMLKSGGATSDECAFELKDNEHSTENEEVYITTEMPSAKRHVIRINGITLFSGNYNSPAVMRTGELITGTPVDSIAIFDNEYVPMSLPDMYDYFTYILTINGKDYEIKPLNSDAYGYKKAIRFSDKSSRNDYVIDINESIKSAKLTVTVTTDNGICTPYISNLKICLGEGVSS